MALTISNAGTNNSTTSSGTLVISGVTASVGDWLVVIIGADNAGGSGANSISSVTDAEGNTYTSRATLLQDPGAADEGATLSIFTAEITSALSLDDVTVNFSPNTTSKTAVVYLVEPDVGDTITFRASGAGAAGATGNGTAQSVITSVTNGDTIFGGVACETNAAITADSDTTNGSWSTAYTNTADTGSAGTSMAVSAQWKTVSSTGNQTYNTSTGSSVDWAMSWLTLYAVEAPAEGSGIGDVVLGGTGDGAKVSGGSGIGDLVLSANGDGAKVSSGSGTGDIVLSAVGFGDAVNSGSGVGDLVLSASGAGFAVKSGSSIGDVVFGATSLGEGASDDAMSRGPFTNLITFGPYVGRRYNMLPGVKTPDFLYGQLSAFLSVSGEIRIEPFLSGQIQCETHLRGEIEVN